MAVHAFLRQITRSPRQAIVFVLCVMLSLVTLVALNGFSDSVHRALLDDARRLHAGDIIIRSYEPVSAGLLDAVNALADAGRLDVSRYDSFYSMVRKADSDRSLLAGLKVVDGNYPFYGQVVLKSGRDFHSVLTPGHLVVEQALLDRLAAKVGDTLKVGHTNLVIADVVTAEPDRPVNIFALGPRVFIHISDGEALGLMQTGSRIRHVLLLKASQATAVDRLAAQLQAAAQPGRESVETFRTARSGIKRFVDNFLFYLQLIGIFILVIAGVGINGTLSAFLKEKQLTIGIMKTLGAGNGYILRHYLLIVLVLGLAGTVLGLAAGVGVQWLLAGLLGAYLPPTTDMHVSLKGIAEGIFLGLVVVAVFSSVPLYRLQQMRPLTILRREEKSSKRVSIDYLYYTAVLIFIFGLAMWHIQQLRFGFYVTGAIAALIALAALAAHLLLLGLKHLRVRTLVIRQAVKGLFRKSNASRSIILTLTTSLAMILCIHLIESNLFATYVRSFPADTPNLYFVDIQPSQKHAFAAMVGYDLEFYPIVRARVTHVNGQPVDRAQERRKRGDNLARVFNLTYRDHLLPDERIIKGTALFRSDWRQPQVSIMDTIAQMHSMDVGDTIDFTIQGVPLQARIASIRQRSDASLSPFFYFVFQKEQLQDAPQTLFTAVKVPSERAVQLQTRVVKRFANVSVIDLSEAIRVFGQQMRQLSQVVRLFSLMSMTAGCLILVSAVFATRAERTTESVYYKILGAGKVFVLKVFSIENALLGMLSGLAALALAQVGAFIVCSRVFSIPYQLFGVSSLFIVAAAMLLVVLVGVLSSLSILIQRPVTYLRQQPDL
jgi:putative ABC transport system permease protein